MYRRTFFRVLGSALVGLAIAPSLAVAPVSPPVWWRSQVNGPGGAITIEMLEEAFRKCSKGTNYGPTYLVASQEVVERYQSLSRQCGLVFDV